MYNDEEVKKLSDLNRSDGWKIVQAECERRMSAIADRLANGANLEMSDIRLLQGEFKALKEYMNKFNIKN